MAVATSNSRSLPNLASVELDEITWTNEVIKAQQKQWSCSHSPQQQGGGCGAAAATRLYHIDDNDYSYSSDDIPATVSYTSYTMHILHICSMYYTQTYSIERPQ